MFADDDIIFRIHGMAGARAASGVMGTRRFVLLSPENAAQTHGAQWFGDLVNLVRSEFPDAVFSAVLDCRGRVSGALAAIEIGLNGVIIDPLPAPARHNLAQMGAQMGTTVFDDYPAPEIFYAMDDHILPQGELMRRIADFEITRDHAQQLPNPSTDVT
ncbi:hypothetical protein LPB41_29580 [Thalassospira sp. MA62]|nr:hypothetical protein [Thalassospira sp. MA62]